MSKDYQPRYRASQPITGFAASTTVPVLGGRAVKQTATKNANGDYPIAHATAGSSALGIAEYDTADPTTVHAESTLRRTSITRKGDVVRWKVGASAITFDTDLEADANGLAVPYTSGIKIARANQTVAANAEFVEATQIV